MRLAVCKFEDVATKKWSQNMLATTESNRAMCWDHFGVKFETFIFQLRLVTYLSFFWREFRAGLSAQPSVSD